MDNDRVCDTYYMYMVEQVSYLQHYSAVGNSVTVARQLPEDLAVELVAQGRVLETHLDDVLHTADVVFQAKRVDASAHEQLHTLRTKAQENKHCMTLVDPCI